MTTQWEDVHFSAHVNIKNIIGKELINDDNVAVLELVKNSYDAGATEIKVKFQDIDKESTLDHKLIISDNGIGMSKSDILDKWLNLAYSMKREIHTQNNRVQAGNKGIGRFSCDRLGQELDIYTKQKDGSIYQLKINWNDFENKNKYNVQIQDIPLQLRELSVKQLEEETNFTFDKQGTIVVISNLNTKWLILKQMENLLEPVSIENIKLLRLKFALEKLINKNQVNDEDFKIFLQSDGVGDESEKSYHSKINGELKNKFFDRLTFNTTYINSVITEDGKKIITKIKDRGKIIFQTIEENKEFPLLKGVKIVLMYLNPYGKQYFYDFMGMRSVEFGSIFLFLNGFRIPPYGDSDKDSFGLEVRKTQGRSRYISNRELVGRIEINDIENQFRVISSREGIVENEAYLQLVHNSKNEKVNNKNNGFFYKTHKKLEKYIVDGLKWDSVDTSLYTELKIQDMIHDKKWNENKEIYKLKRDEKLKNISKNIFQILKLDYKNVIDLYIDKEIISSLVEEKTVDTEQNIIKFLKGFEKIPSSSIDSKTRKSISIIQKSISNISLSKKLEFLNKDKNNIIDEYIDKKEHYDLLDKKIQILEKNQKKLQKELVQTQFEQKKKDEQIYLLKSLQTLDENELINLQHHIGLYAHDIEGLLISFKRKYNKSKVLDENSVFKLIDKLTLSNKKILAINKLVTKEGFLNDSEEKEDDLVKFIYTYIHDMYILDDNINIQINTNNIVYKTIYSPFEFTIILDNLIQNSRKINNNKVSISLKITNNNGFLAIEFYDDGKGLDNNIVKSSIIFDQGFTTNTKGSGLGLYHVKDILNKYNFDICVDEKYQSGFKLVMTSRKRF